MYFLKKLLPHSIITLLLHRRIFKGTNESKINLENTDDLSSLEEISIETPESAALTRENLRRILEQAPTVAKDNLRDGAPEHEDDAPSGPSPSV